MMRMDPIWELFGLGIFFQDECWRNPIKNINITICICSNSGEPHMNELKKIIQILLLLTVLFFINLPLTNAEGISEEINDVNLYVCGKGGISRISESGPPGNLTTKAPSTVADEYQTYNLSNDTRDVWWWYSAPLHLNISLMGNVDFTIWAKSNKPRNISFIIILELYRSSGHSHGHGRGTGSKFVYDQPVEFNAILTKEDIEENDLKNFSVGDRIGIGIGARYPIPQPPAEVKVLFNSSTHPSHMTINTNSMSINILNPKASNEKASIDVVITDAFGIYDIADYGVQITGPSGNNITNLEINEDRTMEKGNLILNITWKKTKEGGGNHTVTITVIDNNDNSWERVEILELNFLDNRNGLALSPFFFVLSAMGVFVVIAIYFFISRKRK